MLISLLSTALAVMLETAVVVPSTDTLDIYMIDGKIVENFDGSQISRKMIQSYKIERVPGSALRMHVIYTDRTDKTYFFPYPSEAGAMTIINGKAIGLNGQGPSSIDLSEYFDYLPEGSIIMGDKKGDVKFDKSDVVVKTGPNRGTIYDFGNAVYVLNGKKISKKEFDKIDMAIITSVNIIKDPKEIQKYDVGNIKTVISITTK